MQKSRKGYFYRGKFIEENSSDDAELQVTFKGNAVSKTDLKKQSTELQKLGEDLVGLSITQLNKMDLSDQLLEAIIDVKKISNFEGRRRQMQYIGKLMRKLDETSLDSVRASMNAIRNGDVQQTQQLQLLENWRNNLIAKDEALEQWLQLYPNSDRQELRNLIRQIRKTQQQQAAAATSGNSASPRQERAFRSLFQLLQEYAAAANNNPTEFD